MSKRRWEIIETLEVLVETQEKLEQTHAGAVRFETSFLREILEELRDTIDIYGPDGLLVCTIEGPNATDIIDMAVGEYMKSVIARFAEDRTSP